jgi:hypothetical protein
MVFHGNLPGTVIVAIATLLIDLVVGSILMFFADGLAETLYGSERTA